MENADWPGSSFQSQQNWQLATRQAHTVLQKEVDQRQVGGRREAQSSWSLARTSDSQPQTGT